jgi:hypothetical protein
MDTDGYCDDTGSEVNALAVSRDKGDSRDVPRNRRNASEHERERSIRTEEVDSALWVRLDDVRRRPSCPRSLPTVSHHHLLLWASYARAVCPCNQGIEDFAICDYRGAVPLSPVAL